MRELLRRFRVAWKLMHAKSDRERMLILRADLLEELELKNGK